MSLKTEIQSNHKCPGLRVYAAIDAEAASADFRIEAGVFCKRHQVVGADINPDPLHAIFAQQVRRQCITKLQILDTEIGTIRQIERRRIGESSVDAGSGRPAELFFL